MGLVNAAKIHRMTLVTRNTADIDDIGVHILRLIPLTPVTLHLVLLDTIDKRSLWESRPAWAKRPYFDNLFTIALAHANIFLLHALP